MIYEILEAKKVTLVSVDSHSGAVGADVTALSPVGGLPVGGNLSGSATRETLFKVRTFAFRAIHAQYDATGKFLSIVHKERGPAVRVRSPDDEIDPRLDLGGLFLKSPGDIRDDNEDLECLEIVVN